MDDVHDALARYLVTDACVAVAEREVKALDEELALAAVEDLRGELAALLPCCGDHAAAEAALAIEALEELLRG